MDIAYLLNLSVEKKASDLHLTPGSPPILRIDGDLIAVEGAPILDATLTKNLVYSVMDNDEQQAFESSLELDFAIISPKGDARFRVNAYHESRGVAAAFRVITTKIPTLEELGAPAVFKELLKLSSGLILVVGPTGCGKSTTLAACIEFINQNDARHIITIEDPIEYIYESKKSLINQRQVYRDSAAFSTALHAALREDPDVILVGEMRDLETIRLALTAAETGHLVLGTLHTMSAPRAVSRIVDIFPSGGEKNIIRNMLSESLQAVISQTLLKANAGGRIAAYEIMLGSPAIRNLIREDKISQMYSVIQTSSDIGMCTMEQSLNDLVLRNIVTDEECRNSGAKRQLFEKTV